MLKENLLSKPLKGKESSSCPNGMCFFWTCSVRLETIKKCSVVTWPFPLVYMPCYWGGIFLMYTMLTFSHINNNVYRTTQLGYCLQIHMCSYERKQTHAYIAWNGSSTMKCDSEADYVWGTGCLWQNCLFTPVFLHGCCRGEAKVGRQWAFDFPPW